MPAPRWRWLTRRRTLVALALTAIVGYAALLRLNALVASYGPYTQPQWLARLQPMVIGLHSLVGPDQWVWPRYQPYVGSDPASYLKFAREMQSFYQAHVREPFYLTAVKTALVLTDDEDVGVSIASIFFSLLLIIATFLIAAQLVSKLAGLAAAFFMAIDRDAVGLAIEGWRDEAFASVALFAVWLWLRAERHQSVRTAIGAGVASGLACLTRLTAPFMLAAPAIALVATRDRAARRRGLRRLLIGAGVAAMLVAPYLIACAWQFGDPLYAINYHTQFYLGREGETAEVTSAVEFVANKWRTAPIDATDNALEGLLIYPFANKWRGLEVWVPGLGTALAWLAAAGLVTWLWHRQGRVLLATLIGSLVPYVATWSTPGGSEWRFTIHAYPFYLTAAMWAASGIVTLVRTRPLAIGEQWPTVARRSAVIGLLCVVGWFWWRTAPYYKARESLRHGRPASIVVGGRDRVFFRDGWSVESIVGNVHARFGLEPWSRIQVPLPERRPYVLVLRMDPVPLEDVPAQRVRVSLNRQPIGQAVLTWNPELVGRYEFVVPESLVQPGANEIVLQPEYTVDAARVADRYPTIAHAGRVGFRFWAVVVHPREAP